MTLIHDCNNIPSSAQTFAAKSDNIAFAVGLDVFVNMIVTVITVPVIDADTGDFPLGFITRRVVAYN